MTEKLILKYAEEILQMEKDAVENVPAARKVCEATLKSEQAAVAECTKAEKLLNMIRSIRTL